MFGEKNEEFTDETVCSSVVPTAMEVDAVAPAQVTTQEKAQRIRQVRYRDKVNKFFADKENYERMERILHAKCDKIESIIYFFVVRYAANDIYHTIRASDRKTRTWKAYGPKNEYDIALKRHKKKFYNFEDQAGTGTLMWEGNRNPRFAICREHGDISLPLAKAVALMWFIDMGFDDILWDRFTEIKAAHETFMFETKCRYTNTHKRKRKERRRVAEEEMRSQRDSNEAPPELARTNVRPRPQTKFTRAERLHIQKRIEELKLKEQSEARTKRSQSKYRRKPNKHGIKPTTAFVDGSVVLL